jgi:hypothetical protein
MIVTAYGMFFTTISISSMNFGVIVQITIDDHESHILFTIPYPNACDPSSIF